MRALAEGSTYLWSTGATTRCITVSRAGDYTLTITKNKQSTTCTKTVTVTSSSCSIKGSSTIIQGQSSQLCVPFSSTSTYLWSTGAKTNCITITAAGTYSVTTTTAAGCTSICKKVVTLTTPPSCLIEGNSGPLCLGQSTQLCAPLGVGYTYLWSNGSTSRCITVNATGNYSVVVSKNGSHATCNKEVTVSSVSCCPISGSNSICEGGSTSLCGPSGTGYTYLWSNGSTSRCITVNAAGTYSLKVTKSGSSTTCSKTVNVTAPVCGISGSSTICTGGSTSLCAPSGTGYTYLWSTGATTRCITVSAAGTSTVTVTKDGCSSTCSRTVNVSTPSSTISGTNNTICEGSSTTICGPSGYGYTYLWSAGATSRCLSVKATGNYSLTVTAFGCSSTSTKRVIVNPKPDCTISGNLFLDPGQTTTLCAPSGLTSYKWSTGATGSCITVGCAGTYSVVTSDQGCISYCSVNVTSPPATQNSILWTSSAKAATDGIKIMNTAENEEVSAYPNPFYTTTTIEFQNRQSNARFVVELYTLSGIKVETLFNDEVEQGAVQQVPVNAGDLPSGVYVYRITNGHQIINRKLLLQRK